MSNLSKAVENIAIALKDVTEDLLELTVVTTTGQVKKIDIIDKRKLAEINKANIENDDLAVKSSHPPVKSVYDIDETGISAKTVIQIDGDIIVKIPVTGENGNSVEIDERMLKIHEENVKMAMENWKTVITTLVTVVKELREL